MASASVSAANAAPSLTATKPGNGGYTVTFGSQGSNVAADSVMQPMSLNNNIMQGQTQWAQKTLSGYTTTTGADLYWGNPSNSLRLRIYTPDGYVLGPYYDNCDGRLNGDIPVQISKSGGLPQGTYYYEIYGDKVSGSQYYTFS